ncbi:putative Alpha/Beta hydrolase protein [Seiridium unicorne]|uniref:Alpha/Beta hydrolase protein n=1 Tax=Seiridium unicorne TaxID=138068 RepID=A0ABR2VG84_9PEZI
MTYVQPYLDSLGQNLSNLFAGGPAIETLSVQEVREMFSQSNDCLRGLTNRCPTFSMCMGAVPWLEHNVSIDSYDEIVADLVLQSGYAVVFAVLEWFTEKGLSQRIVPGNLAVIGDSAGGHIMFGVNILAKKHQPRIHITYNVFPNPAVKKDALGRFHRERIPLF